MPQAPPYKPSFMSKHHPDAERPAGTRKQWTQIRTGGLAQAIDEARGLGEPRDPAEAAAVALLFEKALRIVAAISETDREDMLMLAILRKWQQEGLYSVESPKRRPGGRHAVRELARHLGCGPQTVRRLIARALGNRRYKDAVAALVLADQSALISEDVQNWVLRATSPPEEWADLGCRPRKPYRRPR